MTEDWLFQFGFVRTGGNSWKFGESFFADKDSEGFSFAEKHDSFYYCEHVHQLQNLFFAMRGENLMVKDARLI